MSSVYNNSNYENSTWVEDWSENLDTEQYIQSLIHSGIGTVNVFVGQLDFVNGVPTIDGFSSDTPGRPPGSGSFASEAALKDFIRKLKAAGINVKLSIGGQAGTTFGNSWNKLNSGNIDGFAQALANICSQTGANGIDFDEELEDTGVAALAGQLAAAYKAVSPDAEISFCVFGGINNQGPMHQVDKVFLENAMLGGKSVVDRVYVMSYYDGCTLQQNEQFMLNWMTWLQQNFNFSPSQISIGVDPNDPNTSPTDGSLKAWIEFAKAHGFSTAIWDNSGVDDFVKKRDAAGDDWGNIIQDLYNSYRYL